MTPLPLSAQAESDLDDIAAYIAADNPRAAERTLDRILEQCAKICDAPLAYPAYENLLPGMRRAVCRPFLIFFLVDKNGVRIERILHGARDVQSLLRDEN